VAASEKPAVGDSWTWYRTSLPDTTGQSSGGGFSATTAPPDGLAVTRRCGWIEEATGGSDPALIVDIVVQRTKQATITGVPPAR